MTERFNRTLADMLATYASDDHTDWDRVLPFVTYAYTSAAQTTTGFSPFFLLYGREPSCSMDTILPYQPDISEAKPISEAAAYAEECRQLARSFTAQDKCRQKSRHDPAASSAHYSPGELVWLWVPSTPPGLSTKLFSRYQGPYRILEQTSPANYVVEPVDPSADNRFRGRETIHVARLKPCYDPPVASFP
ncbi:uncharacterized protein LOC119382273 [Rhipicephalus sanguineus]|uniref:uncharacterized protein LOC119382273 n=1 Tax=Rhipicephalus sanguineus TaxID=34632 RepID=UPI0018956A53|nr:uncharacterized protein LOC119382273 [Rhipicephalus sanguineus]